MSSPSRSPSPDSDKESHARLNELKVQVEAATRAAKAKKARKEQEWKERKERKEQERREWEEREEREALEALTLGDRERIESDRWCLTEEAEGVTIRYRGVWEAVVTVAREMAEPAHLQAEREWAALHHMRTTTEGENQAAPGKDRGVSPGSLGSRSDAESEQNSPTPVGLRPHPHSPTSRVNLAEVVITREGSSAKKTTGRDETEPAPESDSAEVSTVLSPRSGY